ncbi:MAG: lysophospholipid acyltransferase family protein [Actinomycetota bacterium]
MKLSDLKPSDLTKVSLRRPRNPGWLEFITTPPTTPKGVEKRVEQPTTGVHYDTEWASGPGAKLVRQLGVWGFMKPAIRVYGSPKVIGTDRLDNVDWPVVFAANHHSHADTTLLLATIPANLRKHMVIAAGADYFFPDRVRSAISALFIGAIPIERTRLSKLSVENTVGAVKDGKNLLIFPEGGRSPDGWGQEHRPGAAFVAKRTGVPVVPIYIDGTGRILPKGQSWPSRSRCAVVFGSPMRCGDDEDARDFAARIETRISELADEFSLGWWEARRRAHAGTSASLAGPEAGAWRRRWALGPKPGTDRSRQRESRWPEV